MELDFGELILCNLISRVFNVCAKSLLPVLDALLCFRLIISLNMHIGCGFYRGEGVINS